jgi:DNA repair protein RadC
MYVSDIRKVRYRGRKSPVIGGAEDVYRLLRRRLSARDREHFLVLLLSSRHAVLAVEIVSVGSLNASIVHPREVLKPAILASAAGIIVAHNHPSGDPTVGLRRLRVGRDRRPCLAPPERPEVRRLG